MRARIGKAWQKWREVAGVVCDKRMSLKTKAKIYKSVIRPVLLYGTESAALRREEERRLEVTEMRMLRNICRISLKEHKRNDEIRKLDGMVTRKQKFTHYRESKGRKIEVTRACNEKRTRKWGEESI